MDVIRTESADSNGRPVISFKSDKFTQALITSKENNGFAFYGVRWEKSGEVPKELKGSYSRLIFAEKAILSYIQMAKKSRAKRTNDNTALREQKKSK